MMNPLVTIITPTFQNQEAAGFQRMLASVQTQTYFNWQHIVCSDGGLEQNIAGLVGGDYRHQYTCTSKHFGGYGAGVRQEMMDRASGVLDGSGNQIELTKYFVFLDDDNILLPDYLEKMVNALESDKDKAFSICKILHFGPLRPDVGIAPMYLPGNPKVGEIDTLQVMVRAEAIRQVGWIKPEDYCSDGYTYEELAKRFNYVRVDECLGVHL